MFLEVFPTFLLFMIVAIFFLLAVIRIPSQIDESDRRLLAKKELEQKKEGANDD